ncbi:hypothetical protein F4604DRAFT_1660687 [Suillus subluteus]|nr:hypothetical protein F4604DRAFT_1660687 [Suillus subluteus]
MRYDIRKPPQEGIAPPTRRQISRIPALNIPTFKILIISKEFPWSIDIRAPVGSVVTCGTIFEELHKQLQRHIEGAEWAMVAVDRTRKEAVEKAAKLRQEKDKIKRLKRIDWLGDKSMFEGLAKDKEFEKMIHLPGNVRVAETWVARFGKW